MKYINNGLFMFTPKGNYVGIHLWVDWVDYRWCTLNIFCQLLFDGDRKYPEFENGRKEFEIFYQIYNICHELTVVIKFN